MVWTTPHDFIHVRDQLRPNKNLGASKLSSAEMEKILGKSQLIGDQIGNFYRYLAALKIDPGDAFPTLFDKEVAHARDLLVRIWKGRGETIEKPMPNGNVVFIGSTGVYILVERRTAKVYRGKVTLADGWTTLPFDLITNDQFNRSLETIQELHP